MNKEFRRRTTNHEQIELPHSADAKRLSQGIKDAKTVLVEKRGDLSKRADRKHGQLWRG